MSLSPMDTGRLDSADHEQDIHIPPTSDLRRNPTLTKTLLLHIQVWTYESLACCLAVITLAATAITVRHYAGSSFPNWPWRITISGLLSIYSTILRSLLAFILSSCIAQLQWRWFSTASTGKYHAEHGEHGEHGPGGRPLYDVVRYNDASAGPWGALSWLRKYKLREPLTATGAILTLAALIMDPILQQLITPVACSWTVQGLTASVPRVNHLIWARWPTEIALDNAVTRGITQPGFYTTASCPTGNCTFPTTFGTLGVCSACEDISDTISLRTQCCEEFDGSAAINCTNIIQWDSCVDRKIPDVCNGSTILSFITSLPESGDWHQLSFISSLMDCIHGKLSECALYKEPGRLASVADKTGSPRDIFHVATMFGRTVWSGSGVNPTTGQALPACSGSNARTSSDICNATALQIQDTADWQCRGYGAANCTIRPCIRLYNTTVHNDRIEEALVDTVVFPLDNYALNQDGPMESGFLDMQCAKGSELDELVASGNFTTAPVQHDRDPRWLPIYRHNTYASHLSSEIYPLPQALISRGCLYLIDYNSAIGLNSMLSQFFFPEEATAEDAGPNLMALTAFFADDTRGSLNRRNDDFHAISPWLEAVNGTFATDLTGPDWLKHTYNGGEFSFSRVTETMGNISESISQLFRATTALQEKVEGNVLASSTCLNVRWWWLSWPTGITMLCILFWGFIATSEQGRGGKRIPVWKGNPLPWIFRLRLTQEVSTLEVRVDEGQDLELERETQQEPELEVPTIESLESVAKGIYVRLVVDEQTYIEQTSR